MNTGGRHRLEIRHLFLLKSTFDCCTQCSPGGWDIFNSVSIRKRATVDQQHQFPIQYFFPFLLQQQVNVVVGKVGKTKK